MIPSHETLNKLRTPTDASSDSAETSQRARGQSDELNSHVLLNGRDSRTVDSPTGDPAADEDTQELSDEQGGSDSEE